MNPDNIQKIKDCFTKRARIEELNNEERDKRKKEILDRKYKLISEIKSYFKDLPFDTYFNIRITKDWTFFRYGYWDRIHNRFSSNPIYLSILVRDIQDLDNRVTIRMGHDRITGNGHDTSLWVLNSYWEEYELIRFKKMLPWIEKQLIKEYGC